MPFSRIPSAPPGADRRPSNTSRPPGSGISLEALGRGLAQDALHLDQAARIGVRHRLPEFIGDPRVVLLDDETCDLCALGERQVLDLFDDFHRAHAWKVAGPGDADKDRRFSTAEEGARTATG